MILQYYNTTLILFTIVFQDTEKDFGVRFVKLDMYFS